VVNFGHMANLTQYSEHKRAEALAVVASCGGKVAEAARRVGVPRRTLQRLEEAADQVRAVQLKHSQLTLTVLESG
jgi:ActR/RegA family two-component response regulator